MVEENKRMMKEKQRRERAAGSEQRQVRLNRKGVRGTVVELLLDIAW